MSARLYFTLVIAAVAVLASAAIWTGHVDPKFTMVGHLFAQAGVVAGAGLFVGIALYAED